MSAKLFETRVRPGGDGFTNRRSIKSIVTSDILIADVIARAENVPEWQSLAERRGLKPGDKAALSKDEFDQLAVAMVGKAEISLVPGGSSANTLTTLNKVLGNALDIKFLGITGSGIYSSMIKNSLNGAGIALMPKRLPPESAPETAVSFVILYPDGQRTILTYPGNAKAILKPKILSENMVESADALLVQGSLWQKLDWEFADRLLEWRWNHHKELWLAMPTQAQFGKEKAGHFQWLAPSANVVLSNEDELARVYHTDPQTALTLLQKAFQENVLEREGRTNGREQVGFITRDAQGAAIVTAKEIKYIPAEKVEDKDIVNKLGAGDTAYAGFLAGYVQGLPHQISAKLGMTLAAAKLRENGPRLADPQAALQKAAPSLASMLSLGSSKSMRVHSATYLQDGPTTRLF